MRGQDLRLAARSLGAPAALKAAGRGQLTADVRGSPRKPLIDLRAHVPLVRLADNTIEQLRLTARVEGAHLPLAADARLHIASLRTGSKRHGGIYAVVSSAPGGGFSLNTGLATPTPLSLKAGGHVTASAPAHGARADQTWRRTIDLARLELSYPGTRWQLQRGARITLDDGDVTVAGLQLAAQGGQQLTLDLRHGGQRLDGHLVLAALDLARLPPLVVPPDKRLAGRVDADVRLRGRLPRPEVALQASLADGRVDRIGDLDFTVSAVHRRGRASGDVQATALGAQHKIHFALPAAWPPPANAPITLEVAIGEVDLQGILKLLGHPLKDKVVGRAGLSIVARGQAGDPDLSVVAQTRGLRVDRGALGDVTLRLRDPAGQPLAVRLDALVFGQNSQLQLDSPVVLARWLRRAPERSELMSTPFQLRANVRRLPLAAVTARPGRRPPDLHGFASLDADLRGPIQRLHGKLEVDAQGLRTATIPPTDGSLRIKLGQGTTLANPGIDARLRLQRRQQVIAELQARLGAPVERLLEGNVRALGSVPMQVDGRLGPLMVQRVGLPAEVGHGGPRVLRAELRADVSARGTLNDPSLKLQARVDNARLGDTPLGNAELRVAHADARSHVVTRIASANGGRLQLDMQAKADLSLASVQRGLPVREIPIVGQLTSRALDLGILSGLNDTVRAVAGLLEADARFVGTVGAPHLAGQLSWKHGRVMLAGLGEYRDIDLVFRGDQREMVLERLFARSGEGNANVSGRALRNADGRGMSLEARAKLHRFRMYSEGQPLGALSIVASADGTVVPERTALAVKIPEAHFYVAEGDRKHLQPLRRPADVVIFDGGQPRDRREERRLADLKARPGHGESTRPAEPARHSSTSAAEIAAAPPVTGDARRMRITVDADRNLWVSGPDMNLELGLDPGFQIIYTDEPRVFGTVKVRRGYVEVMSRRFELSANSSVSFGGPADRPVLAVEAAHKVEGRNEGTTVQVRVDGPADRLSFNLSSPEHPEFGDSELLALVVTGRLPAEQKNGGAAPGDRAASLVGGLLASKVQQAVAKRLPLDVLTLQTGADLTGAGTRLEAGTYLGDDLYVAYVGRLGIEDTVLRENRNEFHLEYQLTSRWSFEGTYGDARQGSADLMWTKNY